MKIHLVVAALVSCVAQIPRYCTNVFKRYSSYDAFADKRDLQHKGRDLARSDLRRIHWSYSISEQS